MAGKHIRKKYILQKSRKNSIKTLSYWWKCTVCFSAKYKIWDFSFRNVLKSFTALLILIYFNSYPILATEKLKQWSAVCFTFSFLWILLLAGCFQLLELLCSMTSRGPRPCFSSVEDDPPWFPAVTEPLRTLQRRCRQRWAWRSSASWMQRVCAAPRGPASCGITSSKRTSSCGGGSVCPSEPSVRGRSTATEETACPGRWVDASAGKQRRRGKLLERGCKYKINLVFSWFNRLCYSKVMSFSNTCLTHSSLYPHHW